MQEVSIIQRGGAAGYTMSRPTDDTNHMTYNQLNDLIAEFMGGRIAEEIVFQDVGVGASNDIMRASDIARKMVTEWGMSKKFGFISFGDSQDSVFAHRDYEQKNRVSEKIAGEIDDEVRAIMDFNYSRAKKIILENREALDEIAKLLLAKNTIYTEEVNMILEGKKVEEIVAIMDEREKILFQELELERLTAEKERKLKEIDVKLRTSEVFMKHGIINEKELNELKTLRDNLEKDIDAQIAKYQEEKKLREEGKLPVEEKPETDAQTSDGEDAEKPTEEKTEDTKTEKETKGDTSKDMVLGL